MAENVAQIYGLIGKAMAKVSAIGKDTAATNYQGKLMYKFRGIDAVYNALNPVMAELGLFIIPEILDQKREERTSSTGNTLIYTILTVRFTMYAPDGSYVQGTVVGEGMDSGDKSTNKAMSIAMKYFCFQTFMIPTEDMRDPDAEVHDLSSDNNKPVHQDAPASVTVQNKLPQNDNPPPAPANQNPVPLSKDNPVFKYLGNEKKVMAQKLGITDAKKMTAWFAEKRKALIAANVVQDIAPTVMTMQQAQELVEAIFLNFLAGEGEAK